MGTKDEDRKNFILSAPTKELHDMKGLGQLFLERMLKNKNNIAHTYATTGETETYEVVLQKTIRTAIAMRSHGIQPNDVITVCSHNTLDCYIPFYASFFVGAIAANLDPMLSLGDTTFLIKQVSSKMVFVIPEAVDLIETALKEANLDSTIVVLGESTKHLVFSDFLKAFPEEENNFQPYKVKNLKDTAVIVFSSGTTGLPKGICLTHYGLLGYSYQTTGLPSTASVWFTFSNLYWIAAVTFSVCCLLRGFNRLLYPRVKEGVPFWDMVQKYKVNMVSLSLHLATDICRNGKPATVNLSELRYVLLGGGPLTSDQIKYFRECFDFPKVLVLNAYGQTEMNGPHLTFNPSEHPDDMKYLTEKPTSVGRPSSGFSYKIVDLQTEEILGPNQVGELLVKTDFAMGGYYKMDSFEVWDADGFMRTGDMAYYDEEQCFYIVDRVKDLLKYKMWHISPSKIEAIFYTHPAVHQCVVTSITHPLDGDHLLGVVILKDSAVGKISENELKEYVDDKLADHDRLRGGVKFVKELPLTVTDKTSRMKLKQLVKQEKI